jgi:hypothetical protein
MPVTIDKIRTIEIELKRFQKRLSEAKKRFAEDKYAEQGCKETGALKRSALDLKNELTELNK